MLLIKRVYQHINELGERSLYEVMDELFEYTIETIYEDESCNEVKSKKFVGITTDNETLSFMLNSHVMLMGNTGCSTMTSLIPQESMLNDAFIMNEQGSTIERIIFD